MKLLQVVIERALTVALTPLAALFVLTTKDRVKEKVQELLALIKDGGSVGPFVRLHQEKVVAGEQRLRDLAKDVRVTEPLRYFGYEPHWPGPSPEHFDETPPKPRKYPIRQRSTLFDQFEPAKNLDEAIQQVISVLDNKDLVEFFQMPQRDLIKLHHSFGRRLRNEMRLWEDTPLTRWFKAQGIEHADDMCGVVVEDTWRSLHGVERMDLVAQAKKLKDYYAEMNARGNAGSVYEVKSVDPPRMARVEHCLQCGTRLVNGRCPELRCSAGPKDLYAMEICPACNIPKPKGRECLTCAPRAVPRFCPRCHLTLSPTGICPSSTCGYKEMP